eukprot:1441326-Prymnesium_polylepis.1
MSSSRLKLSTGGRYGSRWGLQAPRVGGSSCCWGVAGEPGQRSRKVGSNGVHLSGRREMDSKVGE